MSEIPEGAIELEPPQFLPEGWRCVRLTYASGTNAGETYTRYYSAKHKSVSSVKKCIELDAKDRGLDPVAEVKAYEDKKTSQQKSEAPPEQFADFQPDQSGLDSDILAALPPDAPPESEAFAKVRIGIDSGGNLRACFKSTQAGRDVHLQVTKASALDNMYAAFRISRACFLMIQDGFQKDVVAEFKKECLAKLKPFGEGKNKAKQGSTRKKKETHESAAPDQSNKEDEKRNSDGNSPRISAEPTMNQVGQRDDGRIKDSNGDQKKGRGREPEAALAQVDDATKIQVGPETDVKRKRKKDGGKQRQDGPSDATKNETGPGADGKKKKRRRDGGRAEDAMNVEASPNADRSSGQLKKHKRRKSAPEPNGEAANGQPPAQNDGGPEPTCSAELEEQLLAALPPDAPEGHISFSRCRSIVDKGRECVAFQCMFPNLGKPLHLQVGVRACCGSEKVALRISRACYMKAEAAAAKEEVPQLRAKLYAICKQFSSRGVAEAEVRTSATDSAMTKRSEPVRNLLNKAASEEDDEEDYSNSSSTSSSSSSEDLPSETAQEPQKPANSASSAERQPNVNVQAPQNASVKSQAPRRSVLPRTAGRVCAKMLARSGLRCNCHFAMDCPARALGS